MTADIKTFETYRGYLFSIAYRMLGSAMEAEDIVQEAFLRYQQAATTTIKSPKAYLSTITTRLCLDQLKSAKTKRENYVGTWLPEPILTTDETPEAINSERETISMAFLVLLESLSPVERAVFLLRDVFDYDYADIARFVDKSEDNCRRYYHRAKQFVTERRPRFEPAHDEQVKLMDSFMQAVMKGDVEALTHVLAEDIVVYGDGGGKMPASPHPIVGRELAVRLLMGAYRLTPAEVRMEMAQVNATPSLLFWRGNHLYAVVNFTIVDNQIISVRNIFNPDKLKYIQEHH
ncbi:MAG: RNA polymerase sigma-70 factor [Anaerolineae bacterium]